MSDIVWAINPKKDRLGDLSQRMRHFASDVLTARRVVEAYHLDEIDTRIIMRTERWSVPSHNQNQTLNQKWGAILAEAESRGLTSVWLLYLRKGDSHENAKQSIE